ncbi:hypothetical protein M758_UG246900 [Ceratodon purpureus]|nr:hypothetical protein M758_UG246900 [Ceratodon purpureus]
MKQASREFLDMAEIGDESGLVALADGAPANPTSGISFSVSVLSCPGSSTPTQKKKNIPFNIHVHVPWDSTNFLFQMDSTPYAPRQSQSQTVSGSEPGIGTAFPQNPMFIPQWGGTNPYSESVTPGMRSPNPMQYLYPNYHPHGVP